MSIKGYTTHQLVGAALGVELDAIQAAAVDGLIEEAESAIDALAPPGWLGSSPVTLEPHSQVAGPYVDLLNRPVTAVTLVRTRALTPGTTPTTLTAGGDYELIDAARGTLLLNVPLAGQWLEVSYTFSAPAPALIRRVATELAAAWYRPRLLGTTGGAVESVTVGDVSVKYGAASASSASARAIPDDLLALIAQARRPIFV